MKVAEVSLTIQRSYAESLRAALLMFSVESETTIYIGVCNIDDDESQMTMRVEAEAEERLYQFLQEYLAENHLCLQGFPSLN